MSRFIQLTLKTAFILSLVVVSFSYSNAQTPVLWGNLESGSYGVGFKFIYQQDYSRGWKVTEDSNGYPLATGRGRPVRISVWYPAKRQGNAPKMLYRDYMASTARNAAFTELNSLLEKRDVGNLRANLKAEEFDALTKMQTAAVLNAAPQNGAFPLLVYSAGLNNSSQDNFVLCEYLASHGYVVITVPQLGTTSLDVNLKFPSAADLEKAQSYGLGENFRLITSDQVGSEHIDLFKLMRLADVFALPSYLEGLPISIIEAMGLGIPTISTKINAIPEAVKHLQTGLLIEAGNSIALRDAIQELKDNDELRENLSKNGRKYVLEKFNEKTVAKIAIETYIEAYQQRVKDN